MVVPPGALPAWLGAYPKTGTGTYNGYSFAALSVWQMLRIFFMTCIDLWHKTVIDPCQKIRKS